MIPEWRPYGLAGTAGNTGRENNMTQASESVAIYWDFENLHANLVDQAHGQGAYLANRSSSSRSSRPAPTPRMGPTSSFAWT